MHSVSTLQVKCHEYATTQDRQYHPNIALRIPDSYPTEGDWRISPLHCRLISLHWCSRELSPRSLAIVRTGGSHPFSKCRYAHPMVLCFRFFSSYPIGLPDIRREYHSSMDHGIIWNVFAGKQIAQYGNTKTLSNAPRRFTTSGE